MYRFIACFAVLGFVVTCAAADESNGENGRPADEAPVDTTLAGPVFDAPGVVVTATRSPVTTFDAPAPVSVVGRQTLEVRSPNTVADVFSSLPGLEVHGVGVNQTRPGIRGQRGQRILLLEDGLRLNNSRRQSDFGEIPALVDVSNVERVEIVRGPASVLYGSDAIGGVVNVITAPPPRGRVAGELAYRYADASDQHKGSGRIAGRVDALGFSISGSVRDASAYEAPAGSFGDITLDSDVLVNDTGIEDHTADVRLFYDLDARHQFNGRVQIYRADTTGFGYVDPEEYAPDEPVIEIRYPYQDFDRYSLGYTGRDLGFFAADRVDVTGYAQNNERRFDLDLFISFGPMAPPGAGLIIETENFTDLETVGTRVEAKKAIGPRHLVTYGLDLYRDRAEGTDQNTTTMVGFGPPQVETSDTPLVPNATLRNIGVFVQDDIRIGSKLSAIAGVRYQDVRAQTRETAGIDDPLVDATDRTVVGALNASYALTRDLRLVGSVGRAFRSPNLVERFFNGPTPEGEGFQARNTELDAETSLNVELGARARRGAVEAELFVFRNEITDGIRVAATGDSINGMPVFQNVNVEKLRYTGLEASLGVDLPKGFQVAGNLSLLDAEDVDEPELPAGDTAKLKANGWLRYRLPNDRAWAEYHVRHSGERDDIDLGGGPIGDVLPAFTVHALRFGVDLFQGARVSQHLGLRIENLFDELYAESPNASFFRPEPGRQFIATWTTRF